MTLALEDIAAIVIEPGFRAKAVSMPRRQPYAAFTRASDEHGLGADCR